MVNGRSLTLCLYAAVMHQMKMIHTDLKPENILLVSDDYVKVPDGKVSLSPLSLSLSLSVYVYLSYPLVYLCYPNLWYPFIVSLLSIHS